MVSVKLRPDEYCDKIMDLGKAMKGTVTKWGGDEGILYEKVKKEPFHCVDNETGESDSEVGTVGNVTTNASSCGDLKVKVKGDCSIELVGKQDESIGGKYAAVHQSLPMMTTSEIPAPPTSKDNVS